MTRFWHQMRKKTSHISKIGRIAARHPLLKAFSMKAAKDCQAISGMLKWEKGDNL